MKSQKLLSGILLFTFFFIVSNSYAQEGNEQEMMKKWQEYMTPGPVHQQFAKMAGNWKATVTTYMGGQESKSDGTGEYEMILGGRYMKSTFKGNMMGMPFEGMQLDAFDNATKEYISIWIDNFGTGIMVMKGKMDDKTKSITYWGSVVDPMTGKDQKSKSVMKNIDDDHISFEMFMVDNGNEVKQMQIDYTRVK